LRGVSCGRTWMKARSPENIVWVDEGKRGGGRGYAASPFFYAASWNVRCVG
jgi:hypothetical protein